MKKMICMILCIMVFVLSVNTYAMNETNVSEDYAGREEQLQFQDYLTYEVEGDYITIKEVKNDLSYDKIIIPASIDEMPVHKVSAYAFFEVDVKEIVFSEGIKEISMRAIFQCNNLKKVVIPASCNIIGGVPNASAIEYCDKLESVEIYGNYKNLPIFIADCPSLRTVIFHGDIEDTVLNNFKFNFYACKPRLKKVNSRIFTEPLDIVIKANEGTNIEKFAKDNGFHFEVISTDATQNNSAPDISSIDISKYTESKTHKVYQVIPTEYGVVLYMHVIGTHRDGGPFLMLIRENGDEVNLSESITRETPSKYALHNDIQLSEDGKIITFNVSFAERSEGDVGGQTVVVHDAGTYYYSSNLETGVSIETKFDPLDTIGENVISVWAKSEVEEAIGLGFVPLSFRDNYKRNITRSEFAKLAMFFLQMQYGYPGVSAVQVWSPINNNDNVEFKGEFMNAYCATKKDRNGNTFREINSETDYVYHNANNEIQMPELPFLDMGDSHNYQFVERAYHLGIVNGLSDEVFNPDGEITRQEAAAMLMRVYKNYAEFDIADSEFVYSDDKDIATWAKEDVYSINALGVMQGVGEDMFAPLEGYTVEQAIMTFWRLYDTAPVSRKNKNISPLLDYKFESENYFNREGGSYFHETGRVEYDDFIVVNGYWTKRHSSSTFDEIYVFYKYGGVVCDISAPIKWEVSEDNQFITVTHQIGDTFRLYNKLNGTSKVYDKGIYQSIFDIASGKLMDFARVE